MMIEKPILFSSEMVRAILEGRKCMTRRIIKPQPLENGYWKSPAGYLIDIYRASRYCPYGQPGDRLWVRETFWIDEDDSQNPYYKATEEAPGIFPKWRPSIHMPRWASRITLEITNIRVERVQQIKNSEKDCEEEGIDFHWDGCPKTVECDCPDSWYWEFFKHYWDSIYAKKGYGWGENPFVFVVEFRRSDAE